jgi:hypothetical protein
MQSACGTGTPMLHRVGALAASTVSVGLCLWVVQTQTAPVPVTTRSELCALYRETSTALPLRTAEQQLALRRLASELAEAASAYPEHPALNAAPAQSAGSGIRAVLRVPYGTPRDLWVAMRPVAVECGEDPRVGSPAVDALLSDY